MFTKMQISSAMKLTFSGEKQLSMGKRKWCYKGGKKGEGSTDFSFTLNTCKTYGVQSHPAIAHLGHVIVNTVTCCYCRGLATGLTVVILTRFCAVSAKEKQNVMKVLKANFRGWVGGGLDFRVFLLNQFPCLHWGQCHWD